MTRPVFWIGPDLIERIGDADDDGPACPVCGLEMEWEECDACDGAGEHDWETLQFDDPLWYQTGDTERCEACRGAGGAWWCPNAPHLTTDESDPGLRVAPL